MKAEEFDRLTDRLVEELRSAIMHFDLFKALNSERLNHGRIMNQSKHFWSLTINAHLESTRSIIGRVYDQNQNNLGIKSWLIIFKEHFLRPEFFEPHELDKFNRRPLQKGEIDTDIESVTTKDKLVSTFYIKHRHTEIAHISLKNSKNGVSFFSEHPLTIEEHQVLIDRAASLINKYTAHYSGIGYAMTTIENADYRHLFQRLVDD